jgi:hypothetical protein
MSVAPSSTKIFGIRLGVDPKLLVGALLVFAAALFWYNSRGDEGPTSTPPATAAANPAVDGVGPLPAPPPAAARSVRRARTTGNDRGGALRLRPVNGSRGDVDPTLRLDFLSRLREVGPPVIGRSLFTIGPSPQQVAAQAALHGPTIPLQPVQPVQPPDAATPPPAPQGLNIPLRFYGFVRAAKSGQGARGLFMDNDNVVVANEGEVIKGRYLVVELTPNSAKMEDTQLKQGQTLPVVPEAVSQ